MAPHQVYGIGNAIVDIEFQVEDAFLARHSLEKGRMILVDAERASVLSAALAGQGRLSFGGSAANAMAIISRLGGQGFYSGRVADDAAGRFFLSELAAAGLQSNLRPDGMQNPGTTATSLIFITPDAERTMCTHLGITEFLSADDVVAAAMVQSDWLYVEGYLAAAETGTAAAIHARTLGQGNKVKIALSLGDCNIIKNCRPAMEAMIGKSVDLLFGNTEEALAWAGVDRLEQAASALLSVAATCVITRGPLGCRCFDGERWFDVPAPVVQAVNTNGAGDAFAGAFLYGLTEGYSYARAATLANKMAAQTVTQAGLSFADLADNRI